MQNTIIPGRVDQNDYLLFMGTSMAAPHVAGAAALVMQRGVTRPEAVEQLLESTARHPQNKRRDDRYGAGIIDVGQALKKSTADWGAYQLGLSALLGLLLLTRLRGRGLLAVRPGFGAAIGLVLGSSGLFFLSGLGLGDVLSGPVATLLTSGAPGWDAAVLGAAGQGNPLFHSLLLPLAAAVLLYSVPRLRGLIFGLAVGVAGHLLFQVPVNALDVQWIPNVLGLDQLWLALNAGACLAIAHVVARK
jgi:serine protease